jgi:hypothetical protein
MIVGLVMVAAHEKAPQRLALRGFGAGCRRAQWLLAVLLISLSV